MEMSFQSLLSEGEYTHSNLAEMYPYVAKTEYLPALRSLEGGEPVAKRFKTLSETDLKAKQRRQSISEKFRSLHKLLPCDRKMDTGTMLDEAQKYVKFLQAQVSVLQSMPLLDPVAQFIPRANVYSGGLGKLSRQQLLSVVLNSDVVQDVLSKHGCCIYSTEQLALIQRVVAERNAVAQFLSQRRF